MSGRRYVTHTFFSAKATDGVGLALFVRDFKNVVLDLITAAFAGGSAVTLKLQGAIGDSCPDFSAAASVSNPWSFIQGIDLNDGLAKDGSTGFTIAGADDFKKVEFNVNGLDWVNVQVSGYAAPGNVTAKATAFDNE